MGKEFHEAFVVVDIRPPEIASSACEVFKNMDGLEEAYEVAGDGDFILKVNTPTFNELRKKLTEIRGYKWVHQTFTYLVVKNLKEDAN